MKGLIPTLGLLVLCGTVSGADVIIPNQAIDYAEFEKIVSRVGAIRDTRRVTAEQFVTMASRPDTLVLDTRSRDKFELLHVAGAVHLNFSDITREALEQVIPSLDSRILIYCNNNFLGTIEAFPRKKAAAALNPPTFVTLVSYGYENVFELGPVLDPTLSALSFEGKMAESLKSHEHR